MPRRRRPDLGRRSLSNVRRDTSRANRTDDQRETDNDNSRIGMSELRSRGNLSQWTKITVILGNASVDLDSAVSSLVLAFYISWRHDKLCDRVCTKNYRNKQPVQNNIVIPVFNTSKEDFKLKTEVIYALKKQHIGEDQLVFREDVDLLTLSKSGKLDVIMVDYHVLADNDKFLLPHVSEILDHRPKESISYGPHVNINIQLVGSCSTLVCEKIIAEDNEKLFLHNNYDAAFLLYSTIILDTVNFSSVVKKGTPLDNELVCDLEQILKINDSAESRKAVLAELVSARTDVGHLAPGDLLRKDVKQMGPIVVPCFPLLVEEFLQKPNVKDLLDTCLRRESADGILLLGIKILENDVQRDIALYTRQDKIDLRSGIIELLLSSKSPFLWLEEKLSNVDGVCLYAQGNVAVSRKQIMPILQNYLK